MWLFLDFLRCSPGAAGIGAGTEAASHALGRAHQHERHGRLHDLYRCHQLALANDDGGQNREYERAPTCGVAGRVALGKDARTCLYLALQYGIYAANYPLMEEDLEGGELPAAVRPHARKLFGLTIEPSRLQQIREVRRPESRYASAQQVQYELRAAERMYARFGVPHIDTTHCSVEEISSRILQLTGIPRRLRP